MKSNNINIDELKIDDTIIKSSINDIKNIKNVKLKNNTNLNTNYNNYGKLALDYHTDLIDDYSHERSINKKYYEFNDIVAASVLPDTHAKHVKRFNKYQIWVDKYAANRGLHVPHMDELAENKYFTEVSNFVKAYLEYIWNKKHNLGVTMGAYVDSLIYVWQIHSVNISTRSFPWLRRFKTGATSLAQDVFNRRVNNTKYAILNPQLEHLLAVTRDPDVRMAMLFQHRFLLRAEHYCTPANRKLKDCLRLGDIKWIPHIGNPHSLQIWIDRDKNHKFRQKMPRIRCCTCTPGKHFKWSCVVHEFLKYCRFKNKIHCGSADTPVIGGWDEEQTIDYSHMRNVLRAVIKNDLKLDPDDYGTHSFRAGGASEMFSEGRTPHDIKAFGFWKSLDSVMGYIRPCNTDMYKYIRNYDQYCHKRRQDSGIAITNTIVYTRTKVIHK